MHLLNHIGMFAELGSIPVQTQGHQAHPGWDDILFYIMA